MTHATLGHLFFFFLLRRRGSHELDFSCHSRRVSISTDRRRLRDSQGQAAERLSTALTFCRPARALSSLLFQRDPRERNSELGPFSLRTLISY